MQTVVSGLVLPSGPCDHQRDPELMYCIVDRLTSVLTYTLFNSYIANNSMWSLEVLFDVTVWIIILDLHESKKDRYMYSALLWVIRWVCLVCSNRTMEHHVERGSKSVITVITVYSVLFYGYFTHYLLWGKAPQNLSCVRAPNVQSWPWVVHWVTFSLKNLYSYMIELVAFNLLRN